MTNHIYPADCKVCGKTLTETEAEVGTTCEHCKSDITQRKENKQMFKLGDPWEGLSEAASIMSDEDFKKYAMDNFEWKGPSNGKETSGRYPWGEEV